MSADSTDSVAKYARDLRAQRGPAWRVEVALSLSPQLLLRERIRHDALLLDFHTYGLLQAGSEDGAARAAAGYPLIAAAEALERADGMGAMLRIMVAGGLAPDEMQARLQIDSATIETWERLYFDVRDLREVGDWMATYVIERERQKGNAPLAARLKLAIAAGPPAVRAMLDQVASEDLLQTADRVFQSEFRLRCKFDEALEATLETTADKLAFQKMYCQMLRDRARIDLAKRQLAQRCLEGERRHELALQASQRAAECAAKRAGSPKPGRAFNLGQPGFIDALRAGVAERRALELRVAGCPLTGLTWAMPTAVLGQSDHGSSSAGTSWKPVEAQEASRQMAASYEPAIFGRAAARAAKRPGATKPNRAERGQTGAIESLRAAAAERRALELRIAGCPLTDLSWASPTACGEQSEPQSDLAPTSREQVEVREAPHQAAGESAEAAIFGSVIAPCDFVGAIDNWASCA